jgi:hypothetical protein
MQYNAFPDLPRGSKNRLCEDHRTARDEEVPARTAIQADLRPWTRAFAKVRLCSICCHACIQVMAEKEVFGEEATHPEECRKPENVKKFYKRTAGHPTLKLCFPCVRVFVR